MREDLNGQVASSPSMAPPVQTVLILPFIFGDNIVLQQKSDFEVWGKGELGEQVRITGSWNNADTAETTDAGILLLFQVKQSVHFLWISLATAGYRLKMYCWERFGSVL